MADRLRYQFSGGAAKDDLPADSLFAKLSVDAATALLVPKKGDEAQLQTLDSGSDRRRTLGGAPLLSKRNCSQWSSGCPVSRRSLHLREDVVLVLASLGGVATVDEIAKRAAGPARQRSDGRNPADRGRGPDPRGHHGRAHPPSGPLATSAT
ncbi:MAG: hypothetical protein MZV65_36805 [Chromatiales bacterium]|nr:hypothetical protein [Chromatiales bacterium]